MGWTPCLATECGSAWEGGRESSAQTGQRGTACPEQAGIRSGITVSEALPRTDEALARDWRNGIPGFPARKEDNWTGNNDNDVNFCLKRTS